MALDRKLRCYIASPLGFTEAGRAYYSQTYLPALAAVVEPLDPWSFVSSAELKSAETAPDGGRRLRADIGERNIAAIRSAEVVAAYLEGQELDSGTVAELGYAAGHGIPCYALRSDLRRSGDLGAPVNLQVEAFVIASGGRIVDSLDELVAALVLAQASL